MNRLTKEQLYGIAGTILVHAIVLIILLLIVISKPPQQPESGVPVVMGNVMSSSGDAFTYTEVKVAPQTSSVSSPASEPRRSPSEPLITQTDEPTVALNSSDAKKNKTAKPKKSAEELERERKAREAERKRQEAERIAREANTKIASAFGKSNTMTDSGTAQEGKGQEGSVTGNETTGVVKGNSGYGTFDLGDRTLGSGGLPRPVYNVQDEGRVVVNITVNPDGRVINTTINSRTNTANPLLRKAATDAARKAIFNKVETVNNQTGTITYYFKLK